MAQSYPCSMPAYHKASWFAMRSAVAAAIPLVCAVLPLVQGPEGHMPPAAWHRTVAGRFLLVERPVKARDWDRLG